MLKWALQWHNFETKAGVSTWQAKLWFWQRHGISISTTETSSLKYVIPCLETSCQHATIGTGTAIFSWNAKQNFITISHTALLPQTQPMCFLRVDVSCQLGKQRDYMGLEKDVCDSQWLIDFGLWFWKSWPPPLLYTHVELREKKKRKRGKRVCRFLSVDVSGVALRYAWTLSFFCASYASCSPVPGAKLL